MSGTEAVAKIYETYTADELRDAKDEPDSEVVERFSGRAALVVLFGEDAHGTNTTRRRVKRAFQRAGHGRSPADALANARRVLGLDRG